MNTGHAGAEAPIIIKRKKVVKGDGHHGGAWKVAYADFVTAMMAFFLLMWLLNATTEDQRKGIADYFNPSIPISRISGGGSDGLNGSSIFTEETLAKMGTGASHDLSVRNPDQDSGGATQGDAQAIASNLKEMEAALDVDGHLLSEHLMVKVSPEGVILEIVDSDSLPLFQVGGSEPSEQLELLLAMVSASIRDFDNDIKITGHTDSRRYASGATYDNWNLSADRANTARLLLLDSGVPTGRITEVAGRADTDPLLVNNPQAAQNRRITVTLLTG